MEDIRQIRINGQSIGITGMKDAIGELVAGYVNPDETKIGQVLIEKLSLKNYIPSHVHDLYKKAFLQEYKRHMGENVISEPVDGLQIKVLGAGCSRCEHLTREVMAVLELEGGHADLEHIRNIEEIQSYGVHGTPALVMNGDVKHVGSVPGRTRIRSWVREYSVTSDYESSGK